LFNVPSIDNLGELAGLADLPLAAPRKSACTKALAHNKAIATMILDIMILNYLKSRNVVLQVATTLIIKILKASSLAVIKHTDY